MGEELGQRFEIALGELLQRRVRVGLYADLIAGIGRGLDTTSYPILSGLGRMGPATAGALGTEVGLDRSGVSRHATRLEEGGLLHRRPDPDDARGTLLALTEEGERIVGVLRERLAAMLGRFLDTLPPEQAREFVTGLELFVHESRQGLGRPDADGDTPREFQETP